MVQEHCALDGCYVLHDLYCTYWMGVMYCMIYTVRIG